MNIPNKLSLLRVFMVPLFVTVVMLPLSEPVWRITGAALFALTSLTDMLDGKIARKYELVTDFGKFIDPLADKFMVFSALIALLYKAEGTFKIFLVISTLIVIFRELAITSMRMIVSGNAGIVIAAAWLGKVKTVTQIACILVMLLEPLFLPDCHIISYILMALMCIMTIWSGISYMMSYWKYLDPNK